MDWNSILDSLEGDVPAKVDRSPSPPLKKAHVIRLYNRWRYERDRYPGWLVAPENIRSLVYYWTKEWSDALTCDFDWNATKWSAADRILVFRELNWRLELSMVPLFQGEVLSFEQAVSDLSDDILNSREPKLLGLKDLATQSDVLHAWFEIAFAILREARETYNSRKWTEIAEQIGKVAQDECFADRFSYERALWAMWNVDRDRANKILSGWQTSADRPLATIWKAGLLAELEHLGEAKDLLEAALNEIRIAEQAHGPNIRLFSLEGWCTYILTIVSSVDLSETSKRERLQELKAWDCNPFQTFETVENSLSRQEPQLPGQIAVVPGFDPGTHSKRIHFENTDEYLPAFAYIRLFEQAGSPLRVSYIGLGRGLSIACRWIMSYMDFWSPALLVRALNLKELQDQEFSSRTSVALMHEDLVERLYLWCKEIFDREFEMLQSGNGSNDTPMLLSCLVEIMSRLAFRLGDTFLRESFERAVRTHLLNILPVSPLSSTNQKWFKRLFEAGNPALIVEWLIELLKQPLQPKLKYYFEPLTELRVQRIKDTSLPNELRDTLHDAVEWLFSQAQSEADTRRRALYRLWVLHEAGMLAPWATEFGNVLWSDVEENQLPSVPFKSWSVFSVLPVPSQIDFTAIIKKSILKLDPFDGVDLDTDYLSTLIRQSADVSKPIVKIMGEKDGAISWTKDEATTLYKGSRAWWDETKERFGTNYDRLRKFFGQETKRRETGSTLARFLRRVVIHECRFEADGLKDFIAWLTDMNQFQVFTLQSLPYLLLDRSELMDEIIKQIRIALSSHSEDEINSAADAIFHYAVLVSAGKLQPNSSLIDGLIERVIFRQKSALTECLYHLVHLLIQAPATCCDRQLELISNSLEPWLKILELDTGPYGEFSGSERPTFRRLLGQLAGTLSALNSDRGKPDATAIVEWRKACEQDRLPEVRRAFAEGIGTYKAGSSYRIDRPRT